MNSVSSGYFDARTLQFITGGANPVLEWLRLPGDVVFIVGGVVPLLYLCWLSIRYMVPAVKPAHEVQEILASGSVSGAGAHLQRLLD